MVERVQSLAKLDGVSNKPPGQRQSQIRNEQGPNGETYRRNFATKTTTIFNAEGKKVKDVFWGKDGEHLKALEKREMTEKPKSIFTGLANTDGKHKTNLRGGGQQIDMGNGVTYTRVDGKTIVKKDGQVTNIFKHG